MEEIELNSGWYVDINGHHTKRETNIDRQPLLSNEKRGSHFTKRRLLIAITPVVILILALVTFLAVKLGMAHLSKSDEIMNKTRHHFSSGCFHKFKAGEEMNYIDIATVFGGMEETNSCTIYFYAERGHNMKLVLGTYNLDDSENCTLETSVFDPVTNMAYFQSCHIYENVTFVSHSTSISVNVSLWIHDIPENAFRCAYSQIEEVKCGISTMDPDLMQSKRKKRVVNGITSSIEVFPWQAFLTINKWSIYGDAKTYCGGVILNERWILSAGHCYDSSWRSVEVKVGNSNRLEGPSFEVEKFIRHPNYTHLWGGDISLLKLKTPLALDGVNVSPICLPKLNSTDTSFKRCYVSGFGYTRMPYSIFEDTKSITLKQAQLVIQNMTSCRDSIEYDNLRYLNEKTQVCVGNLDNHDSQACHGDSGGPLSCQDYDDDNWYVYGLVSWGNPDCTGSGLYTRVTTYIDWIQNITINM